MLAEEHGVPLSIVVTGANSHDSAMPASLIDAKAAAKITLNKVMLIYG